MKGILVFLRKHISLIAFVGGFLVDTLTLDRVDGVYGNVVFAGYLFVAGMGIVLVHGVQTGRFSWWVLSRVQAWLPILIQFPIGGLFSGLLIFYFKSATVWVSWPFLATLALLLVGNEFFTKRYERLVFQLAIFNIALTMYCVLVAPVILGTMGSGTFVLATLVALLIMIAFLHLIMHLFPHVYKTSILGVWGVTGGVFLGMQVLYFGNFIPPVPLALKSAGVYHSVVRDGAVYRAQAELPSRHEFWRTTSYVVHLAPNEALYCFSAVFAPTDLRTNIAHVWERKDPEKGWVRDTPIAFPVFGGREGGYRGYTIRKNPEAGRWRCSVETERGQVIGRVDFSVVDAPSASTTEMVL
jgi:hypothetical protein